MLNLRSASRGETIIEVMIALSILSLALGISYASASRNLRASRDAQERTIASQHAQSTIEVIKSYATREDTAINARIFPAAAHSVCVSTDTGDIGGNTPPQLHPDTFCNKDIYTVRVDVVPVPVVSGPLRFDYHVVVNWESLASGAESEASMRYTWYRVAP